MHLSTIVIDSSLWDDKKRPHDILRELFQLFLAYSQAPQMKQCQVRQYALYCFTGRLRKDCVSADIVQCSKVGGVNGVTW